MDEEEQKELENLSKLVGGFQDFVKLDSGIKGAIFPDETEDEEDDAGVRLDPTAFFDTIMNSFGMLFRDFWPDQGIDQIELNKFSKSQKVEKKAEVVIEEIKEEKAEGITAEERAQLESSFEEYLASMDQELSQSKVGPSLEETTMDKDSEPVQLNMNLVKNLLDSFSAQEGLAGPASNIMQSLGLALPRKKE